MYSSGDVAYFGNYTPVGDVITTTLCILMFILVMIVFSTKQLRYRLLLTTIILVFVGAALDMLYHMSINITPTPQATVMALRGLYHTVLFLNFFIYVFYLADLMRMQDKLRLKYMWVAFGGLIVLTLADLYMTLSHRGFRFDETTDMPIEGVPLFAFADVFFVGMILWMLVRFRDRLIHQVFVGLTVTFIFTLVIQGVQGSHHQTSFTTVVFVFPIIAMMYLLHSNPYDIDTGAVNEISFEETIHDAYKSGKKLVLLMLHMRELENYEGFTDEMRFEVYHFFNRIVRGGVLFRLGGGRLVLVFSEEKNKNYEEKISQLQDAFDRMYDKFKLDFKIVLMESVPDLSRNNEYSKFYDFIENRFPENVYYRVKESDIEIFARHQYILEQLRDIKEKTTCEECDDPRVLTFCQPVYNVKTHKYDTAEALMRLSLPETGMVFPDQFIHIAEKNGMIHALSLIILNKTCKLIKSFIDDDLDIQRVSVNFCVQELKDDNFCNDILTVIDKNGIPREKIAIELTESTNETDFEIMKARIDELRSHGIKFYLDDFGTGYSNFDRIMELPFDIIKFDRSLVIESAKDQDYKFMVHTFAEMFRKLNYRVLYEGVENDSDEERCISMYAQYLQGYKYSKPIPIEELRNFVLPSA